jgi:nitrogen fixation protein NifU and related proteins
MFNPTILDHFANPRNVGELEPPATMVEATNPVCGDILRIWLLVEQGCIRDIRFKAKGCVAAIASGSALTELVNGKRLEEAAAVSAQVISQALGGLPPESGHAAELAADALRSALQKARPTSG